MKNLFFSLLVFAIVVAVAFFALSSYTGHGEYTTVPDVDGMTIDQATQELENHGLRVKLEKPVYMPDRPLGTVVGQNPLPTYSDPMDGEAKPRKVKHNRTIYLTANRDRPPLVEMPDLVEKHSQRSAEMILNMIGIGIEAIKFERSKYENLVMKQLYKGKEIAPGTKLEKGQKVTLVVGKKNTSQVSVPKIVGLSYREAQTILGSVSLELGEIASCKGCSTAQDSTSAFVTKQSPNLGEYMAKGGEVHVHLATEKPKEQ